MNRHSVAIILYHHGPFPSYFPLWLKSAGANPNFTFMIFTHLDTSGYNIPPNVQVHYLTFDGVKKLIARHLEFDFACDDPYKLCDYRPMFGLIFEDWLKGYDFWGFCDSDVIFGDLGKFITDDILDRYGRIFRNGHLQFFRNTEDVKYFVLHKLPYWNVSYEDIYTIPKHMYFEESGVTPLCEHLFSEFTYGMGQFYPRNFADIMPLKKHFTRFGSKRVIPAFRWKDGKLCAVAVDGDPEFSMEYVYLHMQKRLMKFTAGVENDDSFLVIPNEFVKDHELSTEEIRSLMTPDPEYEQEMRAKYGGIWKSKPTLLQRIKGCIKKLIMLRVGDDPEEILAFKMKCNKLRRRKLLSKG